MSNPQNPAAAPLGPPVDELSYEQARDELVEVVRRLETGQAPLEQSLALWERGEALATRCQQWLDTAQARLEAARSAGDGRSGDGQSDGATAGSDAGAGE